MRHGGSGADVAVVEGVMGMFDGASGRGELASTAHVAKLLDAPLVLVVDATSMARSAAAVVHGFRTFDPDVNVAGVIFNRVGSDHHEELLRDAVAGIGVPVLGALRRDERVAAPERHLGLVPADEREARAREALATLGDAAARFVDLDAVLRLARSAPERPGEAWSPAPAGEPVRGARIAIARGPAFSFHYQENLELLEASGAELQPFDPISDEALPEGAGALVLAGGFPEVFGGELAANAALREEIGAFARSGRPVLAECGGLLYLAAELDGQAMCARPAGAREHDAPPDARLPRGDGGHVHAVARRRASACAATSSTTRRSSRRPAGSTPRGRSPRAAPSAARASSLAASRRASCTCTGRPSRRSRAASPRLRGSRA